MTRNMEISVPRHRHSPVSYTHLDVYKRQGVFNAIQRLVKISAGPPPRSISGLAAAGLAVGPESLHDLRHLLIRQDIQLIKGRCFMEIGILRR